MDPRTVLANLTPEEWNIVCRLRAETPAFEAAVACPEMQADGAPCPSPHTSCDACGRVLPDLCRPHRPR